MLDDRKLKVLHAIISSYIDTAEPIGSRTISKDYDLGVSSATIRNEMSDLEDLGYLSKPHSSAGRVPSDKAYRLYVDGLMDLKKDLDDEKALNKRLKGLLVGESNEIEELIKNSARILSTMTNYTSIVASPRMQKSKINKIQLVPVEHIGILVLLICSNGLVKNSIYKTNVKYSHEELAIVTNLLNSSLEGLDMDQVAASLAKRDFKEMKELKSLMDGIGSIIVETVEDLVSVDLYFDGITNILNFPEYKDIDKAREFMSFVENKDLFLDVLLKSSTSDDIDIIIGSENIHSPIKDISIITATYSLSGQTIGKVGLIGPTRMDYLNLINTVELFSKNITKIMDVIIDDELMVR